MSILWQILPNKPFSDISYQCQTSAGTKIYVSQWWFLTVILLIYHFQFGFLCPSLITFIFWFFWFLFPLHWFLFLLYKVSIFSILLIRSRYYIDIAFAQDPSSRQLYSKGLSTNYDERNLVFLTTYLIHRHFLPYEYKFFSIL